MPRASRPASEKFAVGGDGAADFLLDAQRRLAPAQQKEYQAIAEYNNDAGPARMGQGHSCGTTTSSSPRGAAPVCRGPGRRARGRNAPRRSICAISRLSRTRDRWHATRRGCRRRSSCRPR